MFSEHSSEQLGNILHVCYPVICTAFQKELNEDPWQQRRSWGGGEAEERDAAAPISKVQVAK
jgi:hypothetical protein